MPNAYVNVSAAAHGHHGVGAPSDHPFWARRVDPDPFGLETPDAVGSHPYGQGPAAQSIRQAHSWAAHGNGMPGALQHGALPYLATGHTPKSMFAGSPHAYTPSGGGYLRGRASPMRPAGPSRRYSDGAEVRGAASTELAASTTTESMLQAQLRRHHQHRHHTGATGHTLGSPAARLHRRTTRVPRDTVVPSVVRTANAAMDPTFGHGDYRAHTYAGVGMVRGGGAAGVVPGGRMAHQALSTSPISLAFSVPSGALPVVPGVGGKAARKARHKRGSPVARPYVRGWHRAAGDGRGKRASEWPRPGLVAERVSQLSHLEFSFAQRVRLRALVRPPPCR